MKNYLKNDYALNKHSEGIVFRFADRTKEVTLSDYLAENPGKTESDFAELKKLSDSIYLEQDMDGYRQTWKNLSLHHLDETEVCSAPSPENEVIDQLELTEKENHKRVLAKKALDSLTEVQRRRYLMYHVGGMTTRELAKAENVKHQSVCECLSAAEKRIRKILWKG